MFIAQYNTIQYSEKFSYCRRTTRQSDVLTLTTLNGLEQCLKSYIEMWAVGSIQKVMVTAGGGSWK